jgi:hypothetical protein
MMGEGVRGEDLFLGLYDILQKKSIKHQIFYALCFFFGNFNSSKNNPSPLTPHPN